ncbi:MAG: dTDP-4-dehydrorhamnose reductase [Caldicoprobacterales bacterium]|jgi:dTDP-4-dehydrorhamnose reductase|nr:dTDP-4-dehydrorhamnose reductase [Clostridiales bacterium]
MKVIVTGASGLLGADIVRSFKKTGHAVIGLMGRKMLDVTKAKDVIEFVSEKKPDLVIHCAGFRMVDLAEKDPVTTYSVNTLGSKNVALACQKQDIPMVHISSDSVFDGESNKPYTEFDPPNPVNVYGHSKLMAECEVRTHCHKHFIIRVPLLFGALGYRESNYIYQMVRRLKDGERLKFTTDQLCSPTYTKDVGDTLVQMVDSEYYGLYHLANQGEASRYCFYSYCAEKLGFSTDNIQPILQEEKPARRPKNTLFASISFNHTFPDLVMRDWRSAVEECVVELKERMA